MGSDEFHPNPAHASATRAADLAELADAEDIGYWMDAGTEELIKALDNTRNENVAKNIIIFVGDGMSIPTVSAARTFKGQHFPSSGEKSVVPKDGTSEEIFWESFPNMGLSKTYSVSSMTPDSAATATAMFSGVKTVSWTLGFDSHIIPDDPASVSQATPVPTILDWAQEAGMKTGIITNTRVTHATPAALYAKSASRNWECDSEFPKEGAEGLKDIALQMMEESPGKDTDLIFGGGLAPFVNYDLIKPNDILRSGFDYAESHWNCHRNDNRSLIKEWEAANANGKVIYNKTQLMDDDLMNADKVRGFFSWSYMPYEHQYTDDFKAPTLEEMTTTAIKYLENKSDENGFFLMVEGGLIDHAHHGSEAVRALRETLGLESAVASATGLVDTEETLIIVTADHAHTFSMGGYSSRFADITMEALDEDNQAYHASDHLPFTILAYGNGAGANKLEVNGDGDIVRPELPESLDYDYKNPSGIPLGSETHGGDDVGIWAIGPMSHLFHTTHQQSYIAHVMSHAACIGPHGNSGRCEGVRDSGSSTLGVSLVLVFTIISRTIF